MHEESPGEFRAINLLKGALVGALIASLCFLFLLFTADHAPRPAWDLATARRYWDLIDWKLVTGLVSFFAIVGYLLNNKYGRALSRAFRFWRAFGD